MKKSIMESDGYESDRLKEHIRCGFSTKIGVSLAESYIKALLSPVERKNGWQLSEALGEENPYRLQQFLYRGSWDYDVVRDALCDYVVENIGDKNAVLILDETGFLKKGNNLKAKGM